MLRREDTDRGGGRAVDGAHDSGITPSERNKLGLHEDPVLWWYSHDVRGLQSVSCGTCPSNLEEPGAPRARAAVAFLAHPSVDARNSG